MPTKCLMNCTLMHVPLYNPCAPFQVTSIQGEKDITDFFLCGTNIFPETEGSKATAQEQLSPTMAATVAPSFSKLLAAFLILCSVAYEACGKPCDQSSVNVSSERTGRLVEGQPEWEVVVRNTCSCNLSHVQLTCTGFSTVKEVDPSLFRKLADDQDHCLVNDGKPIAPGSAVRFTYAWLTPYDLPFFSVQSRCT